MAGSTEAPKLTKDQVEHAFSTFGYTPSNRDALWWSTQDDFGKLVADLKGRRDEEDNIIKDKLKKEADQRDREIQQKEMLDSAHQKASNPSSSDGKGGPPDANGNVTSTLGGQSKTYAMGNYSLVKFAGSSAVFWADHTNNTLRPFLSQQAFDTSFSNPEEANKAIVTMD